MRAAAILMWAVCGLAPFAPITARAQGRPPSLPVTGSPPLSAVAPSAHRIGRQPTASPCVTVDIAGHRAGHLDCASIALEQAARAAQAQTRAAINGTTTGVGSPDVRLGVANQTATRLRMGNSFGVSVLPQRPDRAPAVPRPGGWP